MHRPNLKGMTAEQSAPVHEFAEFLHEALDAYDTIRAFRKGSGPVAVPWPEWLPAIPPAGVGPDICRWEWEDISARGRKLGDEACRQFLNIRYPADPRQSDFEAACFLDRLVSGHIKAYRLVRYAWWECTPQRRAVLDDWAKRTRAHLNAMPLEQLEA
jgi:hypothetical protein